jgi:peptide/nickel transport system ATP-binding protein
MVTKILEVIDYKVYYKTLIGHVRAVDGVSLTIPPKTITGVIGESGSGKSTLAQSIILPKYPMQYMGGRVVFEEHTEITKLSPRERSRILLTKLAYIPQYALNALPSVKKIGALIKDLARDKEVPYSELYEVFKQRLNQVNLPERVLNMYPMELSGGMRQRVVIAISTLFKPTLLIADEPTSALDVVTQRQVLELIKDLRDNEVVNSVMMISHDIASIRQISDRIATMYAGKIVEEGLLEDTIRDPLHPYTQHLVKSVPPLGVNYREKRLEGLKGAPPSLINPPEGCRFQTRCPYATERCRREGPPLVKIGESTVACWLHAGR